jgi:protein-S-isoprenylcysteine O-methyltransferase Ste14
VSAWTTLARFRVPLGFLSAIAAFALVRPTPASIVLGIAIALPGELLRVWASGHIDKGREITRSGPYRFVRHPLYLGSAILGVGFVAAARSGIVAALVLAYLAITLVAAMRTEEATLDARFQGAYSDYRAGRAEPVERAFEWRQVKKNREYRAVSGFVAGFAILTARLFW